MGEGLIGTVDEAQDQQTLAQARNEGEAEAEAADLKLKLEEMIEREQRLLDWTRDMQENIEDAERNEHDLREQIERFARFHQDVERSLPWRLIQRFRRMLGREW
jgi:hypothetical protein